MVTKDIKSNNKIDMMINNYVIPEDRIEASIEVLEMGSGRQATTGVVTLKVSLPAEVIESLKID